MEAQFFTLNVLLAFATSVVITAYDIPVIISLARSKKLVDEPDNLRKLHGRPVPSLGGIAIFVGIIISFSLFMGSNMPAFYPFLVASSVLLLTVGVKDDIVAMRAFRKFLAQLLAASIVVIGGNLRLTSLDGFLGLSSVPDGVAILWTILAIVFIINAFNLIDGIDGLAAILALVGALFFGIWFFINGHIGEAILAAALLGALLGFLRYNLYPARIFMGDTGSLVIGLILAVMAFRMIELNAVSLVYTFNSPTVFAISLMIIPLSDTFRIILVRLIKRKSPFLPDRNHIHHRLIKLGFGHRNICRFLVIVNIIIIALTISLNQLDIHFSYFLLFITAALILPSASVLKRMQKSIQISLRQRKHASPAYYLKSGFYPKGITDLNFDLKKKDRLNNGIPSAAHKSIKNNL
jgi:UDP-GlcNAc:undecaprenyl-phosphate/decaprenyl-phosphate GlcNAc-1-phosphate transferase